LSSIETGVSIIIPQGAIPEGIEQEIYFKVCRDNSILPPLDKEKGKSWLCTPFCYLIQFFSNNSEFEYENTHKKYKGSSVLLSIESCKQDGGSEL